MQLMARVITYTDISQKLHAILFTFREQRMPSQIHRVMFELRNMILSGELQPGNRIVETQFTERLGASRTPLRLALAELEREGILERSGARGFQVRRFSITDIANAIDVRGALEGLAVRLLAQKPDIGKLLETLRVLVDEGDALIAPAIGDSRAEIDVHAWAALNGRFHAALIEETDNRQLVDAVAYNNRIPFVGPDTVMLPVSPTSAETAWMVRAQQDHQDIFNALLEREFSRAEALAVEHLRHTRQNKQHLILRAQENGFSGLGDQRSIPITIVVEGSET